MAFKRGFKSWAENASATVRKELGLREVDPLDPKGLAQRLGAILLTPHEIPELEKSDREILLAKGRSDWSAVTLTVKDKDVVIYNPTHSVGRRNSDQMHELAHILIGHQQSQFVVSEDGNLALRQYNKQQEDEADWLAGTLLLPRTALVHIRRERLSESDVRASYGVSDDLLQYRIRMTGVDRQLGRAGSLRNRRT